MDMRAGLVLLLVAASAAVAATGNDEERPMMREPWHRRLENDLYTEGETLMQSEAARLQLGGGGGYISYGALKKTTVPCNNRGQSYYGCRDHQQANPYQRSCTMATRCARTNR